MTFTMVFGEAVWLLPVRNTLFGKMLIRTKQLRVLTDQIITLSHNIDTISNAILNDQEKFNLLQKNVDHFNDSKVNSSEIIIISNQIRNLERNIRILVEMLEK